MFSLTKNDDITRRGLHVQLVSRIARTIGRALNLNLDLIEAIALGHDIGHTPFGHAGERTLRKCREGGFNHYEQSVRVVEKLEKNGNGLNLTWEVRDGILHHTGGEEAATPEGRIVRWADKIAYVNHDMDDAIRAGVLREEDVPMELHMALGDSPSARIDTLVMAMIRGSQGDAIAMDPEFDPYFWDLHSFMYDYLYFNPKAKSEESKVDGMITALFEYYVKNPDKLPAEYALIRERDGVDTAVCDYIAGMTDNFALEMYHELYVPRSWTIKMY